MACPVGALRGVLVKPFVKLAVAIPGVCLVGALVSGPASATPTPPPAPKSTGHTFNGGHGTVGNVQGGNGNIYLEGTGHTVGNVSNTITVGSAAGNGPGDAPGFPVCFDIRNGAAKTAILSQQLGFPDAPELINPGATIRNVCTDRSGFLEYGKLGGLRIYGSSNPTFYADEPATWNGTLLTLLAC